VALVGCVGLVVIGVTQPRWLAGSAAVWTYCLWLLLRGLDDNRREGESRVLASFGWPTLVSVARGGLLAMVAGFVFLPTPLGALAFAPAVAYSVASLLDHVDGRLARALGRTTRLGEKLDIELDALGILIASALAVQYEKVPPWYIAIGLARYGFVLAIAWRRRCGASVVELDPLSLRRVLAGVQMGFLSVALWPPIPSELTLFVAPVFGGATLAMFARDWWRVSGRLVRNA
jgi:CDP-diacylglycerol--glycerol-3-phosphate 3-phosphatidyltransferase